MDCGVVPIVSSTRKPYLHSHALRVVSEVYHRPSGPRTPSAISAWTCEGPACGGWVGGRAGGRVQLVVRGGCIPRCPTAIYPDALPPTVTHHSLIYCHSSLTHQSSLIHLLSPSQPNEIRPWREREPWPYTTATAYIFKLRPQATATSYGHRLRPQATASGYGHRLRPQATATGYGLRLRPQATASGYGLRLRPQATASGYGLRLRPQATATDCSHRLRPHRLRPHARKLARGSPIAPPPWHPRSHPPRRRRRRRSACAAYAAASVAVEARARC